MTRANVIQLGLVVFCLGGLAYWAFLLGGVDDVFAGIAAEAALVMVVVIWIGSYLFRVVTGKMTFMEQRKRYRKEYEKVVNDKLESKFNALSKEEKEKLMEDLEKNP